MADDTVVGTLHIANRCGKPAPYLKFDRSWQDPWSRWIVGGDVVPTDIYKWCLLEPGNAEDRRFSAKPSAGDTCHVALVEELEKDTP